ncbi:glycosyltransferase [Rhizobium sp. BK068]|uniref:glycosyltransferase n=1 Tax=Rhizobium sp. BK068 TaxID=2512130 RepID=UPI0010506D6F|nr:glycosyltransferase [Rhizobium sp. BK068]TCM65868.1 glycosyltransferase involved in cell wall biosynthesis [Rhizobium sp. BK068]
MTFSGNRTPKISIVTPSLNQSRFLQTCLDSVRAQNWPNLEHFVIDGGSTDGTLEILQCNRSSLTDFVSEPDKGAADAINKGLVKCTGDIVAWLNADDFYLPGALHKVAEAWRANPDAGFWFGNGLRVDEAGKTKSVFNARPIVYNHRALVEGLDYILQPATFMNAEVLENAGALNPDLRWSFDWDLWIRLARLALPATIDEQLAASREWESTLTAGGGFRRAEELRLMAESHSGKPMTHGALCYWLDTLTGMMRSNPAAFQGKTLKAARQLWSAVQVDMQRLQVDASGMPTESGGVTDFVIGVDLYPLNPGTSGGIVPWVQGVLREMVRLYPNDRVILFHRPGHPPLNIDGANVEFVSLSENPTSFYKEMTRHCEQADVSAIVRSYPQEHHPDYPFERQIFVIPDLQHEYFPDFFSRPVLAARRRAFAYALSRGGAIATMTDHSRSTVLDNPWTASKDVFLMPAALPEELLGEPAIGALPQQVKAFDRFFYMPANLWPHKNHRRLFEAFRRALPALPPKTGLVLTGSPEGLEEALTGYEDLPILHLGFVAHEQVGALFRDTEALVYFSLFEGFGIPLLEAFRHNTPVLCSNSTSLPEVGGDAVLSCDPTDVGTMADLMTRIVNEAGLRESLSAKAAARLAVYDWATPAHALHAALERRSRPSPSSPVKHSPLISIVMPTRNHGHFIRASIDSVLNQTYNNVELVVMDGASTDDTVEILKSYGERIRWVSEPDRGQADAINKGMKLVRGDILAYLNSDDILLPGALEKVVGYFESHPECDLVYGEADYIDRDGNITGKYATADFSFERLMHDCCICQPAAFWRRRIADRTGPFDASLQTAMDYEYWLRMAASGGIIHHSPEKLAQSRLHEDAKTLAMRGKIFEEVFKICQQHGGYVSLSYYLGLWHYRIYETSGSGMKLRRFAPRLYYPPALVHFSAQMWRLGQMKPSRQQIARTTFNVIDRRLPVASAAIRKAWRRSTLLRKSIR